MSEAAIGPVEALGGIEVSVAARVGMARVTLATAASFAPGSLVVLDCSADAPVALLVNGVAIAKGELVVTDDGELAVEITDVST